METIEVSKEQLWLIKESLDKSIEHGYVDFEEGLEVKKIIEKAIFKEANRE
jgi:hypothetical protein